MVTQLSTFILSHFRQFQMYYYQICMSIRGNQNLDIFTFLHFLIIKTVSLNYLRNNNLLLHFEY